MTSAAYIAAKKAGRHIGYQCRGGCPPPGPAAPEATPVDPADEDQLVDQPAEVLNLEVPRGLAYIAEETAVAAFEPPREDPQRVTNPLAVYFPDGDPSAVDPPGPLPPAPVPDVPEDAELEVSSRHPAMPAGDRYKILPAAGRKSRTGQAPKDHLLDITYGYKYSMVNIFHLSI